MAEAIQGVIPPALGVAISPVPILAVLLMLLSDRELPNALAFLVGWTLALALLTAVVWRAGVGDPGEPSAGLSVARMVAGLVLLATAAGQWRARPRGGGTAEPPRWMERVLAIGPPAAFGLGVVLVVLNAKEVSLTLAAAAEIGEAGVSGAAGLAALAVYVGVSSLTVALPVLAAVTAGERVVPLLHRWRGRLERHGPLAVALLCLGLGGLLLAEGIAGLI